MRLPSIKLGTAATWEAMPALMGCDVADLSGPARIQTAQTQEARRCIADYVPSNSMGEGLFWPAVRLENCCRI
jgi:hypothetical protein